MFPPFACHLLLRATLTYLLASELARSARSNGNAFGTVASAAVLVPVVFVRIFIPPLYQIGVSLGGVHSFSIFLPLNQIQMCI